MATARKPKTGIQKPLNLQRHGHSYASHLKDGGTDLGYIQSLLGHLSSNTTVIYTHVYTKKLQKSDPQIDDM